MPEEIMPEQPLENKDLKEKASFFSNKTPLLVLVLLIITAILVYVAISPQKPGSNTKDETQSQQEMAKANLSFSDPRLTDQTASASAVYEVDVVMNSEEQSVNGVQLELGYEPKDLNVLDIKTGDLMKDSVEILKKINKTTGRISFAFATPLGEAGVKGSGVVATIRFAKPASPTQEVNFYFTQESVVTSDNTTENVLGDTTDTYFTLEASSAEE